MRLVVYTADSFLGSRAGHIHFWVAIWGVSPVPVAPGEAPGGV